MDTPPVPNPSRLRVLRFIVLLVVIVIAWIALHFSANGSATVLYQAF
jgi:hypothetical protein